ncbi:MAG: hydroxyethylthiazole kinase, partial [Christensenellaceae bacterium]
TSSSGVDASTTDLIAESNLDSGVAFAQQLSLVAGSIIAITGPIDIIASPNEVHIVRNGHPCMAKITGTGCMSGAVMGSYIGANPEAVLDASVAALCAMGICGENAHTRMLDQQAGLGTYRTLLIDCMSTLDGAMLDQQKKRTLWGKDRLPA